MEEYFMKTAVVGSRNLYPSDEILAEYLLGADEIVSGGARGVDSCAAAYAKKTGKKYKIILIE